MDSSLSQLDVLTPRNMHETENLGKRGRASLQMHPPRIPSWLQSSLEGRCSGSSVLEEFGILPSSMTSGLKASH